MVSGETGVDGETMADRAPPHGGGRRPAARRTSRLGLVVHALLLVALVAGLFALLPQLGGLSREAAELRHARSAFMVAAVMAQALSLAGYAQLYRTVLASLGAKLRFRTAADVILASFLVSHLTPLGSATGSLVNVSALEAEGIGATTTGEAIALTSLVSSAALITLFGVGLVATAGHHVSHAYLLAGGAAFVLVVIIGAAALVIGAHPATARRAGRWAGTVARRFRRDIDPEQVASACEKLASLARTALTGRAFGASFGFACADLLFDLTSLGLMFVALGWWPGLGPLTVAYATASIASAIPITPGGLGVIEVTLVAVTVGFGTPKATAVLAVLGYRIINYWLPLLPAAVAYLRLRLRRSAVNRSAAVPSIDQ